MVVRVAAVEDWKVLVAFGFGGAALYDVVMEHLDQSIEASTNPEHQHRLRSELRAAEQHVNAIVEALGGKPDAPDVKLDQALARIGKPQEGRVHEWLQAVARSLHQGTNENETQQSTADGGHS